LACGVDVAPRPEKTGGNKGGDPCPGKSLRGN
jgi:hypothetical protein